jgi:hypothetical protein
VVLDESVFVPRRWTVLAPVISLIEHDLALLDQRLCVLIGYAAPLHGHDLTILDIAKPSRRA